jgi:hypothetical protein
MYAVHKGILIVSNQWAISRDHFVGNSLCLKFDSLMNLLEGNDTMLLNSIIVQGTLSITEMTKWEQLSSERRRSEACH